LHDSCMSARRDGHCLRYPPPTWLGLPIEVHGQQPDISVAGTTHTCIYHPIVASLAETGDLVDVRLREGNVRSGVEWVDKMLYRVSAQLDACFPEEQLLPDLEVWRAPPWTVCATILSSSANRRWKHAFVTARHVRSVGIGDG